LTPPLKEPGSARAVDQRIPEGAGGFLTPGKRLVLLGLQARVVASFLTTGGKCHFVPGQNRKTRFPPASPTRIVKVVDSSPQSGDLALSVETATSPLIPAATAPASEIPPSLLHELWTTANAHSCGLTHDEFGEALTALGTRFHHNCPPQTHPDAAQRTVFYRSLHLPELALTVACARGREVAWEQFLARYRTPLLQAAIAITGSATLGHDLADSLYAELYGLREQDGQRRSPLSSYSGRGSLLGWLRTTLAQRHVDHHRRAHRESPLDDLDPPAATAPPLPIPATHTRLAAAVATTLSLRTPEERFLLAAYYLDRQTLQQIGHTLHVHEATISRRLKSLTADIRKQLLKNLQRAGLDKRSAQEALGADPRDLKINLHTLLQTSQSPPFSVRGSPKTAAPPSTETPNAASDSL
jgi:RNA polymerase sigma-70 factor (ECF subfamily)